MGSIGFEYFTSVSDNWSLSFASEAIYSDDYQTNTNNNPIGVQDTFWRINARASLSSNDGKWDLAFIGRNLDDELYQGGTADKPGAPGGLDAFGGVVRDRQMIFQVKYAM